MGRRSITEHERQRGKRLGLRLRKAREKNGITQQQLARLTDLDLDALRGLEQGRYAHPSFFNVAAILLALHIDLSSFLKEYR